MFFFFFFAAAVKPTAEKGLAKSKQLHMRVCPICAESPPQSGKSRNRGARAIGNILPLSPCSFEKASHRKTRRNLKRKLLGLMILKDGCNPRFANTGQGALTFKAIAELKIVSLNLTKLRKES